MVRSRVCTTLLIALLATPLAVLEIACSRRPEQQTLTQFFRAARARDNTTLGMMSAVNFDPREHGTVSSFDITAVSPEQRAPLDFKTLLAAQAAAREAEAAFTKRKIEYQNANMPVLEQLIKAEQDPKIKMTPAMTKVKAEWDKWREDTGTHAKAISAARAAVASASGPAEASLTQPGQAALDPSKFEGELITKAVTLNAQVQEPGGQTSAKTMVITMQRVVGKLNGQDREGRWVITQITGA